MTFLKTVVECGWIYIQSLTYKNLTNKFPGDRKACPPSTLPALGPLHFSSARPPPTPVLSMPGHFSTAMETAREELGSSGKTVVSKVREDAKRNGPDGARPQRQLLGRARCMPPLFSLMCWECLSSIYFYSLGLYFFKIWDVCERNEESSLFSFVCLCELGQATMTTHTNTALEYCLVFYISLLAKGFPIGICSSQLLCKW